MLYRGEIVFDESNTRQFEDREEILVDGEIRCLSRLPPPASADASRFSTPFAASGIQKIPRNEWDARLQEQIERRRRVSDFCDFDPLNQSRTKYCWNNGPVGSVKTTRRIQGLKLVNLSPASVGGPITGYRNRGGWEGDAYEFLVSDGASTVDLWPANAIDNDYNTSEVQESRKYFKVNELVDCDDDFDAFATCCLLTMPGGFAYNWMRHVMEMCDLVKVESGSYGLRVRNSWGKWGAKNELGYYGFAVYREGKGTPDSGWMIRQVTPSFAL